SRAHRASRWRCGARATTGRQPSAGSPASGTTTSRPARSSCGTSTSSARTWCVCIARGSARRSTGGVTLPRLSPPCRAGRCRWTICSPTLPLLVLHRAPLVARAAEQVAERRHDLADAADEEAPAAIGVAVDPAARDLVAEPRARQVLEAEARVLPCQGLQLGAVEQPLRVRGPVEQTQRMPCRGCERAAQHRADGRDPGPVGDEDRLRLRRSVEDERPPRPGEADRRAHWQPRREVGVSPGALSSRSSSLSSEAESVLPPPFTITWQVVQAQFPPQACSRWMPCPSSTSRIDPGFPSCWKGARAGSNSITRSGSPFSKMTRILATDGNLASEVRRRDSGAARALRCKRGAMAIHYEKDGHIVTITIDRPEQRNS